MAGTKLFSEALPGKEAELWMHIFEGFWNLDLNVDLENEIRQYAAYQEFFITEIDAWRCRSEDIALETYQDLIDLVKHLKGNATASRNSRDILDFFIPPRFPNTTTPLQCENSIFLAIRLWLMVNVGHPKLNKIFPGKTNITWREGCSITQLLANQFPKANDQTKRSDAQYPRHFNVRDLQKLAGLDVVWTDHLVDHLRLDLDLNTISLYHHISILKCQGSLAMDLNIFPVDLIRETEQTLALLMPRSDVDCKKWCDRQQKRHPNKIDLSVGSLMLSPDNGRKREAFTYWDEKLFNLLEAFEESQPKGLSQFWRDRRNKVQWYTFWIAVIVLILTVVFGLIQSVTGIMQVNLAYHPARN